VRQDVERIEALERIVEAVAQQLEVQSKNIEALTNIVETQHKRIAYLERKNTEAAFR
jgi:hypothetical protein